ncbi:hypothetical protein QFZ94_007486 [Paraburkholderia sp. JPY465]|uniref:ParB/Srx family N-terminal domain-containing protein n=1 Tax=Paraburkholderia sp. JPY465 TaxID=3042285 RepID=UPI003D1996EC
MSTTIERAASGEIAWPDDAAWPIGRIRESSRNPRTHSDEQIEQIAESMRRFGWTFPVLVDESGELIAGHGRYRAALLLGFTDTRVMVARGWSEAKIRAYRILDNKLALNGGWDSALLSEELAALANDSFPIEVLGFSDTDMARLLDDTDRLALEHAAQSASQSDPTDWRNSSPMNGASAPVAANGISPVYPEGATVHAAAEAQAEAVNATASPGALLAVFSCMVTIADRPALLDAINRAKSRGATDTGAALVLIAREWLQAD